MKKDKETENRGEVVLYKTKDGQTALDVRLQGDTVWLSINQMAELFDRDKSVVSRHLKDIFDSKELSADEGRGLVDIMMIRSALCCIPRRE